MDDTLIPDVPAAREAIAGTLRSLGLAPDAAAVDGVLRVARARWRACPYRELPELARVSSWEALWLDPSAAGLPVAAARWVVEYGRSVWQDAVSAGEASDQFRCLRAELVSPFPEVPETLAELSAHHELWLATEGAGSLQRRKLAPPASPTTSPGSSSRPKSAAPRPIPPSPRPSGPTLTRPAAPSAWSSATAPAPTSPWRPTAVGPPCTSATHPPARSASPACTTAGGSAKWCGGASAGYSSWREHNHHRNSSCTLKFAIGSHRQPPRTVSGNCSALG
ncbi:hypothetical protein P3T35_005671 [Kitasatospora sp. GP30]|nr:hypothetical protein [Kitasatospora sp. GP30]